MKNRIYILVCAFVYLFAAPSVYAQGGQSLKALLDDIVKTSAEEDKINKTREAKFRMAASEQESLLKGAEAEVVRQEQQRDALRATFDENEVALGELQELLDRRTGDLGELFGVFRQTAGDAETVIFSSLISLEYPDRKAEISVLAETTEVPSITEMRKLWELLIEETALSGDISRFKHTVIDPDGTSYDSDVLRVGTFNVIAGDKYLDYLPESESLVELSRQPAGHVRATAGKLFVAEAGAKVKFTVDPSRGALLGLLVQAPSLLERVEQGGTVGYAIIVVGIFGLLIVLERILRLMRIRSRINTQMKNLDKVNTNNPVGRIMTVYFENKNLDLETTARKLQEVIIRDMAEIKKGLPIVKVLAAVAPLMGLLGTVVGMIGTFQAITLFGTGDPKLMAGGISQALITTVLGLVAAIPLLLTHTVLSSRVTQLSKIIAEQAAGLMAKKAESDYLGA